MLNEFDIKFTELTLALYRIRKLSKDEACGKEILDELKFIERNLQTLKIKMKELMENVA